MAEHISQPSSDHVDHYVVNWDKFPITGAWFTKVNEGLANKNTSDYWRAVDLLDPIKLTVVGFPTDAPGDMVDVYELRANVYMKSTRIVDEPGVTVRLYYDHIDIPSAAAGTDTLHIYTTGGGLAGAAVGDLVTNFTAGNNARVKTIVDDDHVQVLPLVTGQTVGDHIDLHRVRESKTFHIDTSGLWKSFGLPITVTLSPAQLDDLLIGTQSADGDGGFTPISID